MKKTVLFLFLTAVLITACDSGDVEFTYSPSNPKAGETITFTPYNTTGDKWEWDFGDGSGSTIANATKIYKRAGTYLVTLKVNDKKSRTVSKEITVLDTIPTISLQNDSVLHYLSKNTLEALIYNPYNYDIEYEWELQPCFKTEDTNDNSTLTIYPTSKDTTITISLSYRLNKGQWETIFTTLKVEDTPAPTLIMANTDGQLFMQHQYTPFAETPQEIKLATLSLSDINTILTDTAFGYIIGKDKENKYHICAINLNNHSLENILTADFAISSATLLGSDIYFTTQKGVCKISSLARSKTAATEQELIFADNTNLQGIDFSLGAWGIDWCNNIFFVGNKQSMLRFGEQDINSGAKPALEALYTDGTNEFTQIKADRVQGYIYTYEAKEKQFSVSKIDGTNQQFIAQIPNGVFAIDNSLDIICYSTSEGVVQLPLVHSATNISVLQADTLNTLTNLTAIAIDNIKR